MLQKVWGLNLYTCGRILGCFHVFLSFIGFFHSIYFLASKPISKYEVSYEYDSNLPRLDQRNVMSRIKVPIAEREFHKSYHLTSTPLEYKHFTFEDKNYLQFNQKSKIPELTTTEVPKAMKEFETFSDDWSYKPFIIKQPSLFIEHWPYHQLNQNIEIPKLTTTTTTEVPRAKNEFQNLNNDWISPPLEINEGSIDNDWNDVGTQLDQRNVKFTLKRSFTSIFACLRTAAFFILICASYFFIYGIEKKRPTMLLPLLGFDVLILLWAVVSYLALQGLLLLFILFNVFCGLCFYVLYVMFSVYRKMKSDGKAKDASQQIEA